MEETSDDLRKRLTVMQNYTTELPDGVLSKEEIVFCNQMDNISIIINKLKYYNFKFCKKY